MDIDPAYFNAETGIGVFAGRYHLEAGYGWTVNNHWRGTLVLNTNNAYGRYLNARGAWTSRTNNDGLISYMLPNEDAAAYLKMAEANLGGASAAPAAPRHLPPQPRLLAHRPPAANQYHN